MADKTPPQGNTSQNGSTPPNEEVKILGVRPATRAELEQYIIDMQKQERDAAAVSASGTSPQQPSNPLEAFKQSTQQLGSVLSSAGTELKDLWNTTKEETHEVESLIGKVFGGHNSIVNVESFSVFTFNQGSKTENPSEQNSKHSKPENPAQPEAKPKPFFKPNSHYIPDKAPSVDDNTGLPPHTPKGWRIT